MAVGPYDSSNPPTLELQVSTWQRHSACHHPRWPESSIRYGRAFVAKLSRSKRFGSKFTKKSREVLPSAKIVSYRCWYRDKPPNCFLVSVCDTLFAFAEGASLISLKCYFSYIKVSSAPSPTPVFSSRGLPGRSKFSIRSLVHTSCELMIIVVFFHSYFPTSQF